MEDLIFNQLSYPILSIVTFFPLIGVILILIISSLTKSDKYVKWIALVITILTFIISLPIILEFDKSTYKMQFVEIYSWIPAWNIKYKVGIDGISVLFIALTSLLSILCVTVSWKAIQNKVKEFFISLLIMEVAMIGIFVSLNFFLFYLFWELMLIPMFLLIGVFGGLNRKYAAIKFVLFTLAGSVFMLIGIIVLYFVSGEILGKKTFDILELSTLSEVSKLINAKDLFSDVKQSWLFVAFFAAFAVKVPMFPFHTWLPDAHTEAPTAGSVILAGILLKMGAYGFLRFSMPMFPDAIKIFSTPMLILSVVAIIYGAYVTLMQKDLKRLIAYSSVSHMGFVTLGLFTLNQIGLEGGILQMINHGVVTGALFLCIGIIYERTHTREIVNYGGLFKSVPIFTTFFAIFVLAAIGLPGMNAFVGEFLIISGAFTANTVIAAFSIVGVILGVTYMGWLYYRVALNEANPKIKNLLSDLDTREIITLIPLVLLVFLIGLQPDTLLSFMHVSVEHLLTQVNSVKKVTFLTIHDYESLAQSLKEILKWIL